MTRPSRVPGAAWSERDQMERPDSLVAAEREIIKAAEEWFESVQGKTLTGSWARRMNCAVISMRALRAAPGTT